MSHSERWSNRLLQLDELPINNPYYQRIINCLVPSEAVDLTLIEFLSGRFTYHSRNEWHELILDGQLLLNSEHPQVENTLNKGDLITYQPRNLPEPPVDGRCRIVYEDDDLLIISKSGDLPIHPAGPFYRHTLWYMLSVEFGPIHIVNRLDRETSGLLLVGKTAQTAAFLSKEKNIIAKRYHALVFGQFNADFCGRQSGFLIRDLNSKIRKKQRFVSEVPTNYPSEFAQKTAITEFKLLAGNNNFSLLEAQPITGRLHQIRATLYSLGYPLPGDKLYGPDEDIYLKIRDNAITVQDNARLLISRQALHAAELEFIHPRTGELIKVTDDLSFSFVHDAALHGVLLPPHIIPVQD